MQIIYRDDRIVDEDNNTLVPFPPDSNKPKLPLSKYYNPNKGSINKTTLIGIFGITILSLLMLLVIVSIIGLFIYTNNSKEETSSQISQVSNALTTSAEQSNEAISKSSIALNEIDTLSENVSNTSSKVEILSTIHKGIYNKTKVLEKDVSNISSQTAIIPDLINEFNQLKADLKNINGMNPSAKKEIEQFFYSRIGDFQTKMDQVQNTMITQQIQLTEFNSRLESLEKTKEVEPVTTSLSKNSTKTDNAETLNTSIANIEEPNNNVIDNTVQDRGTPNQFTNTSSEFTLTSESSAPSSQLPGVIYIDDSGNPLGNYDQNVVNYLYNETNLQSQPHTADTSNIVRGKPFLPTTLPSIQELF